MGVSSIIALFLFDIDLAFLPVSADTAVVSIILTTSVFFLAEILLRLFSKTNYLWSFRFLLDILGTASLFPDVLEIILSLQLNATGIGLSLAGRVGRIARSAATVRFTRLFRVVRLIRVTRVFQLLQAGVQTHVQRKNTKKQQNDAGANKRKVEEQIHTPSKLGIVLGDTVRYNISFTI